MLRGMYLTRNGNLQRRHTMKEYVSLTLALALPIFSLKGLSVSA